ACARRERDGETKAGQRMREGLRQMRRARIARIARTATPARVACHALPVAPRATITARNSRRGAPRETGTHVEGADRGEVAMNHRSMSPIGAARAAALLAVTACG